MPKVSIIVPIYKAEKYLNRCIDSILDQTFTDWELLLIDDGSPDRSGDICEEYAKRDRRIRAFHKENGGVSSARNLGLDSAKGEYVTFIDADDWIDFDNLSTCTSIINANKLDILQYSFKRIDDKGNVLQKRLIKTDPLDLESYIKKGNFNKCVGGAYIRSAIIQNNKIRFDEDMRLAEDQLFIMRVMSNSLRLQATDLVYYNYFLNVESATNNEKTQDMMRSSYKCIEFKQEHPLFAYELDDLVLFFVEKLILRHCYTEARRIMASLKPLHYKQRPWPSACMAYLSQYSTALGIAVGCLFYPIYCVFMKLASYIKKTIK